MVLPTIWENGFIHDETSVELSSIWKKLPRELVDIIMKEYLFSLDDLEQACFRQDIKTIQFICKHCKLNSNQCLILAAMNGHLHVVKYMIKYGK